MSANKSMLLIIVALGVCALVAGCGSDPVAPTDDEAPVLPPENLTAAPLDTEKLVIAWDPNSHPKLAGYNVYRLVVATQEMVKMTPVPIQNTSFTDASARRGVTYEYRVTAMTKAGKESVYASTVVLLMAEEVENPGRTI